MSRSKQIGTLLGLVVLLVVAGCTHRGPAEVFHHVDDMLGCEEVAVIARSDGCLGEVPACCAIQRHTPPTEAGAIKRLARAAAELGGNAVMLLHTAYTQSITTHCETCCSPELYRSYGVVFRCEEPDLQWHRKHEADPTKP
jgi:hypothetical protein